jgi:hypothetical protein
VSKWGLNAALRDSAGRFLVGRRRVGLLFDRAQIRRQRLTTSTARTWGTVPSRSSLGPFTSEQRVAGGNQ